MNATTIIYNAGLQCTTWGRRIIDAEERGRFTELDKRDAPSCIARQVAGDAILEAAKELTGINK